jgi:hypothetical protein
MSAIWRGFLLLSHGKPISTRDLTVLSGYELPRLNERLVYLVSFSIYTSVTYGLLQKAAHRTLLPYTSVSVSVGLQTICLRKL